MLGFELINAFFPPVSATSSAGTTGELYIPSGAFTGNPACIIEFPPSDPRSSSIPLLQGLAAQFNLAETGFLVPRAGATGQREWELRWFTPTVVRPFELCSEGD